MMVYISLVITHPLIPILLPTAIQLKIVPQFVVLLFLINFILEFKMKNTLNIIYVFFFCIFIISLQKKILQVVQHQFLQQVLEQPLQDRLHTRQDKNLLEHTT